MRFNLHLSLFEQMMLGAMIVVLAISALDAMDGDAIGKSKALDLAKRQGQQEFMATQIRQPL